MKKWSQLSPWSILWFCYCLTALVAFLVFQYVRDGPRRALGRLVPKLHGGMTEASVRRLLGPYSLEAASVGEVRAQFPGYLPDHRIPGNQAGGTILVYRAHEADAVVLVYLDASGEYEFCLECDRDRCVSR